LKFPRGVVKGTFLKRYYLLRKISEGVKNCFFNFQGVKHFFEISEGVKKIPIISGGGQEISEGDREFLENFRRGREIDNFQGGEEK
jgi:hypothetical protein